MIDANKEGNGKADKEINKPAAINGLSGGGENINIPAGMEEDINVLSGGENINVPAGRGMISTDCQVERISTYWQVGMMISIDRQVEIISTVLAGVYKGNGEKIDKQG